MLKVDGKFSGCLWRRMLLFPLDENSYFFVRDFWLNFGAFRSKVWNNSVSSAQGWAWALRHRFELGFVFHFLKNSVFSGVLVRLKTLNNQNLKGFSYPIHIFYFLNNILLNICQAKNLRLTQSCPTLFGRGTLK